MSYNKFVRPLHEHHPNLTTIMIRAGERKGRTIFGNVAYSAFTNVPDNAGFVDLCPKARRVK